MRLKIVTKSPHENISLTELSIGWLPHLLANVIKNEGNAVLTRYIHQLIGDHLSVELVCSHERQIQIELLLPTGYGT